MALMTRLTRLFRADLHALLDRLEEPDALLREAIREMQEALAAGGRQLQARELEREQLGARLQEIERTLATLGEELELCFSADNQALVRKLLRRRLEGERLQRLLAPQLEQLDAQIARDRSVLDDQRERLEQLQQKAALFDVASPAAASGEAAGWSGSDPGVSEADVELALLRELQRRKGS